MLNHAFAFGTHNMNFGGHACDDWVAVKDWLCFECPAEQPQMLDQVRCSPLCLQLETGLLACSLVKHPPVAH